MSGEVLLSATGLTRDFGGRRVVDDVDLTLQAGEVLGLLGPNGAGKSTTLKMLTGVLAPSLGSVSVCGFDLERAPNAAKRFLGYLPEEAPLYPDLTVDEYLGYCAALKLIDPSAKSDAIAKAKGRCGLTDVGSRLIGKLSKGYKQRIGIAQAIIHAPSVLILDEPTNGLDPNQIRDVRALVRELAAASQALIISTHILSEVQTLCDKVMIIDQGKLCYSGELNNSTANVVVEMSPQPEIGFFQQLDGVSAVKRIGDSRFSLSCTSRRQVSDAVAKHCVENKVELVELSSGLSLLEQLFFDLTCNDGNPEA